MAFHKILLLATIYLWYNDFLEQKNNLLLLVLCQLKKLVSTYLAR